MLEEAQGLREFQRGCSELAGIPTIIKGSGESGLKEAPRPAEGLDPLRIRQEPNHLLGDLHRPDLRV